MLRAGDIPNRGELVGRPVGRIFPVLQPCQLAGVVKEERFLRHALVIGAFALLFSGFGAIAQASTVTSSIDYTGRDPYGGRSGTEP